MCNGERDSRSRALDARCVTMRPTLPASAAQSGPAHLSSAQLNPGYPSANPKSEGCPPRCQGCPIRASCSTHAPWRSGCRVTMAVHSSADGLMITASPSQTWFLLL